MLKEYEHRLDEVAEKTALPEPLRKISACYCPHAVIPLENPSYIVKKILKGYSFEGLY